VDKALVATSTRLSMASLKRGILSKLSAKQTSKDEDDCVYDEPEELNNSHQGWLSRKTKFVSGEFVARD